MTQHKSWTGTHPSLSLLAEARQERDTWKARAENVRRESDELEATGAALAYNLAVAQARIAELEKQLAATVWQPMDGENYPRDPNQKIQMIVDGYCREREEWQTEIGQEIRAPYRCIRGWRPIDTSQEAQ